MDSVNGGNGLGLRPLASLPTLAPSAPIAEIIDTSVADFTAQACKLEEAPPFGGFVKVTTPDHTVYAVVFAIHTGGLEPGARPVLRGRDGMRDQEIFDANPDLGQLLRTEIRALIVGFQEGGRLRSYLPPKPPPLHWSVVECDPSETVRLTTRLDYFRTILSASEAPVDALLAANVRLAGAAHPDESAFRLRAGRELATLLKHDYPRLTSVLRALVD